MQIYTTFVITPNILWFFVKEKANFLSNYSFASAKCIQSEVKTCLYWKMKELLERHFLSCSAMSEASKGTPRSIFSSVINEKFMRMVLRHWPLG